MIEKFAGAGGKGASEFLDLNHTRKFNESSVPYDFEVRSRAKRRTLANFEIGTLGVRQIVANLLRHQRIGH